MMSLITNQYLSEKCQALMHLIRSRPDYLADKDAIQVLSKAAINGNKIKRETLDEEKWAKVACVDLLCDYAQLLLDFSYAIELKIVNEEFARDYHSGMQQVFLYLDEAVDVLRPLRENTEQTAGSAEARVRELRECIYWRKGALLYMFCHTAYHSRGARLHSNKLQLEFLSYAGEGVTYLAFDMRQAREKEAQQEYITTDDQLLLLIKQGIFSDVNMLSLMYAAEMCYWISIIDDKSEFSQSLTFSPSIVGRQLADQYIRIADGPLKESRWSIDQAASICKHFHV